MLSQTTTENHALESMMDDLFSEISDDLAEVINGGVGNCHYKLILKPEPMPRDGTYVKPPRVF